MWQLFPKRFFVLTLFRELGISNSEPTKTCDNYKNINHDTLLKKYFDDLLRYFGLSVSEDKKRLPSIYWLPNLHKNSTKARFIIAAPACSANPLPKYITSVFKLVLNQAHAFFL